MNGGFRFDYPLTPPPSIPAAPGATPATPAEPAPEPMPELNTPWAGYRILGWSGGQFAVLEVPEGLVLLDP